MEPFLENTNYSEGMINTTINMTEISAFNTTKIFGITKFCTFNHRSEQEMDSTEKKLLEFIEII